MNQSPITKERIKQGIDQGVIRFIEHYGGTVCEIGEYWFYFGGQAADEERPEKFLRNADMGEIIDDIHGVLEDFLRYPDEFGDEFAYYDAILREAGIP